MTTTTVAPATAQTTRHARGYAVAGLASAVCAGIALAVQGASLGAAYDPDLSGDPTAVAAALADATTGAALFHLASASSAVLLVLFGAGLARRLRGSTDSVLPSVALAGAVITAAVLILGGGLDTEFGIFAPGPGDVPAEHISFYGHWIGTIPCLWTGLGLTALSTAVAASRRILPRWHATTGFALGTLTLGLGVSPLEYMAVLPGVLWLLVTSVGLLVGERR